MSAGSPKSRRFVVFAWLVLAYNLLVILWGAVVRATGSGAGCGEHWPLCQGVVIPHGAAIATVIEFAHRASSGVAVVLVIALVYFAFRRFEARHPARACAVAALCFTFTEGAIGAALVLFGWTGNNTSPARFVVLAIHLANTFMLLASLALTAKLAAGAASSQADPQSSQPRTSSRAKQASVNLRLRLAYGLALLGTIALAITGTVAALADTLFPAASLAQGLSRDFSASSSYLLRLRVIHPVLAVIVGLFLLALAARAWSDANTPASKSVAAWLFGLVILQAALGALNLTLLAPVSVQVLHLLVADLVWIALVLLAAEVLGKRAVAEAPVPGAVSAVPTASIPHAAASAWNRRA